MFPSGRMLSGICVLITSALATCVPEYRCAYQVRQKPKCIPSRTFDQDSNRMTRFVARTPNDLSIINQRSNRLNRGPNWVSR
jgi:hypothetical protein